MAGGMAQAAHIAAVSAIALLTACTGTVPPAPKATAAAHRQQTAPTFIPRQVLFADAEYSGVAISPSGDRIAFLKPVNGVLNVWTAPVGSPDRGRPVTTDRGRGIRQFRWSGDGARLLYLQDQGGNENFQVISVTLSGEASVDLTRNGAVRTEVLGVSAKVPGAVLLGFNDRNPRAHDAYRVSLADGSRTLAFRNDRSFASFVVDSDLQVRVAVMPRADGRVDLFRVERGVAGTTAFLTIERDQAYGAAALSIDDAGRLLFLDNRRGDLADLVAIPLDGGKIEVLARAVKADISDVLTVPATGRPLAVFEEYDTALWTAIDQSVAADFKTLSGQIANPFDIVSTDGTAQRWIVSERSSIQPRIYHVYSRAAGTLTRLFAAKPALDGYSLAQRTPVVIPSQDGLPLVSYLTLPPGADGNRDGRPDKPVPLVLDVHGGPYARDRAGFDAEHQWLANRGYAVLSVHFRGSTGLGKAFQNAGDREWGGKMHRDLIDAVDWAIAQGIADRDRVAVYGVSYGGYSALLAAAFTPDRFACNIDVVGPVNLVTLFKSTPPYWLAFRAQLMNRVGDPDNPADLRQLMAASPISKVDAISKPLLVGQGANDPRVKKAEPDQLVAKARSNGIPVTYIVYPDEGHGFARPANRISFFSASEQFLAQCLGGRAEPFNDDLNGSSIVVEEGADLIDGFAQALARKAASQ